MGDIGFPELLIILAIIVVLFGPDRVARLGAALGQSIREFRASMRNEPADRAPPPTPARSDAPPVQTSDTPQQ
jgi:sec-independent protein translocase protein TatA